MPFPFSLQNGLIYPSLSPVVNQDLLDFYGSGVVQSARYINPLTQDFDLQPNGAFYGENAVVQEIWLALNTNFGSASQSGFGQTFSQVPVITQGIVQQMSNALGQTLATLINLGRITLGSVNINQIAQNGIQVAFSYYNNTSNANETITFTLQNGVIGNVQ